MKYLMSHEVYEESRGTQGTMSSFRNLEELQELCGSLWTMSYPRNHELLEEPESDPES